jgi:hypothetical protein
LGCRSYSSATRLAEEIADIETRTMASTSGLLLGVGFAVQFTTPLSGLSVLAAGAAHSAVFLP